MEAETARFAREVKTYEAHREALLRTAHRSWIVVLGERLLGPYPTAAAAWKEGIDTFQGPGFMLRRILQPEEEVVIVSHVDLDQLPPS